MDLVAFKIYGMKCQKVGCLVFSAGYGLNCLLIVMLITFRDVGIKS